MSGSTWSAVVGTIAAISTTLSFFPQLVKVRRQGGGDLSSTMLAMYLAGLSLWLVYGVINHAGAIIGANIASIALVSAVAIVKARQAPAHAVTAPLRIAIDMDEVMADALGEHVRRYNAHFGASLSAADTQGQHLEDCVPPERRAATEALLDASFFEQLAVMVQCEEVVRELAERHQVFVVTAAMDVPCSFDAKYRWLQRHFPFIPPSQIVFCGDKGVIDADYLIDDRARHFTRFKGKPLLFSAPHNAHVAGYPRVSSWAEVREFFAALEVPSGSRAVRSRERAMLAEARS